MMLLRQSSVSYCLEAAGLSVAELDSVVFYDKPGLTFDRIVESFLSTAPSGVKGWLKAIPRWVGEKFQTQSIIEGALHESGFHYTGPQFFTPHHLAHASAAFFPSPYEHAAILTVDGVGEWATASYGIGTASKVTLSHEMHFPNSIGLLYSAFTHFCGFKVNSGEYKLMGLAPYGTPRYLKDLKHHVAAIEQDGTVRLNLEYFSFLDGLSMVSPKFNELFGGPPRAPESRITRREMDLAASIQAFIEEAIMAMARHVHRETREKHGAVRQILTGRGALISAPRFQKPKSRHISRYRRVVRSGGSSSSSALTPSRLRSSTERSSAFSTAEWSSAHARSVHGLYSAIHDVPIRSAS
jgi:carbamoyltransferase